MTFFCIKVGKPAHTLDTNILSTICIHTASCSIQGIIIGDIKLSVTGVYRNAYPHLIVLDERENLFIMNCIHVTDDDKLLFMLNQLRDIFPEQGKWRVCHDNIYFVRLFDTM